MVPWITLLWCLAFRFWGLVKEKILQILNFKEGSLPVTRLRVPLVSTVVKKDHCRRLFERITARVTSCYRHLSCAGRLQLINSILRSLHVFCCCVFLLSIPKATAKDIDKRCRNFLCMGSVEGGKKWVVAGDKICRPKNKGSLGIKVVMSWNKAAIGKQVWDLVVVKSYLWASWTAKNKLRNVSFWGIAKPLEASS